MIQTHTGFSETLLCLNLARAHKFPHRTDGYFVFPVTCTTDTPLWKYKAILKPTILHLTIVQHNFMLLIYYFVPTSIHRGYYIRAKAVHHVLTEFLLHFDGHHELQVSMFLVFHCVFVGMHSIHENSRNPANHSNTNYTYIHIPTKAYICQGLAMPIVADRTFGDDQGYIN